MRRLFPRRWYESGSLFALWRWTDVDWRGATYLLRLHLVAWRPLGSIMLHWIESPDPHQDPHDHPVSFVSVTLRGSYVEWTPDGAVRRRVRFRRCTDVHRIVLVEPGTLTLVFAGPFRRDWGFHTPQGFVPWRVYRKEHAR